MGAAIELRNAAPLVVRVDFYGDELEVARDGEVLWVSVRRVCEALGIAEQRQLQKLKGKPWATVTSVVTVAADGKHRETACISLRSLPVWLATIELTRLKNQAAQKKLALYQKEAADVLARIFIDGETVGPAVTQEQFALVVGQLDALRAANDAMAARLLQLLERGGTISDMQVDWIRGQVVELAYMRCALGKNPHLRSARMAVENRVNAAAQWGGRGQKRRDMPADRMPLAKACLAGHRADLEAELKQRKGARKRLDETVRAEQQKLFNGDGSN